MMVRETTKNLIIVVTTIFIFQAFARWSTIQNLLDSYWYVFIILGIIIILKIDDITDAIPI